MSGDAERIGALMERYGIGLFELREGDLAISLRRGAESAGPAREDVPAASVLCAPTFGRLHFAHPAETGDPPSLPRRVKAGEIAAYLAVGPILRPVTAERDCTLRRALRPEGAVVGYGEPLFET